MSDTLPPRRGSLDSLKKEAKRWLGELRTNAADARARLERALADVPAHPTLRDVQHALAREQGFPGWTMLKQALAADRAVRNRAFAEYETMAEALLEAYRTGTPEAMERHYRYTWHRRVWQAMRTYVQLDLGKRSSGPNDDIAITLDDARYLIAIEHGFANWDALEALTHSGTVGPRVAAKPVCLVNPGAPEAARTIASSREWDAIIRLLATNPSARLHAQGQMTDTVLADISRIEAITALELGGSKALTDEGVRHLARLPALKHLDLSGTAITDRGLRVFRHLRALETISLAGTPITDEGVAHLAQCHELQQVNLSWTRTGDAALRALAGKPQLHHFASGNGITDAGISLLHELPVFKSWQGIAPSMALLDIDAGPNYLLLRGPFTDHGVARLVGLDGLFALNIWSNQLEVTAAGLAALVDLPQLGWLGFAANNESMRCISALPQLRFLMCQDTVADDDGFVALSRSRSIEVHLGPSLPQPADARVHGTGGHAGVARSVSELPECRRYRRLRTAHVSGVDRAHADGRPGRRIPSHRQMRAARLPHPDVLPRHDGRGNRAHHRIAQALVLLQQLHDDHGSDSGAALGNGLDRAHHVRWMSRSDERRRGPAHAAAEIARAACVGQGGHRLRSSVHFLPASAYFAAPERGWIHGTVSPELLDRRVIAACDSRLTVKLRLKPTRKPESRCAANLH